MSYFSHQGKKLFSSVGIPTSDPGDPPDPEDEDGTNLLVNSKWTGIDHIPDNWTNYNPDEGSIIASTLDATVSGHRDLRFISTQTDYSDVAVIYQDVPVQEGLPYVISAYPVSNDGAASSEYVVLNHTPFGDAIEVTTRPVVNSVTGSSRIGYQVVPAATGTLRVLFGVDRGSDSDVTLNQPMVDQSAMMRNYVATDPVELPDPDTGDVDVETIPWDGLYEGWIGIQQENNTTAVDADDVGFVVQIRRSGTLLEAHVQHASNFSGETSKSKVSGVAAHSYPASWDLGIRIYRMSSKTTITGSAIYSYDYTFTNPNGTSAAVTGNARVIVPFTGLNLSVTAGEYLAFKFVNRESVPNNDFLSINANSIKSGRSVGLNASPNEYPNLFFGDSNFGVIFNGSNGYTPINRMQHGVALRYTDDYEDGCIAFDSTGSAFTFDIGGDRIARQRWSAPYWRRASSFYIGAWRTTGVTPSSPLNVEISGSDITTVSVDVDPSLITSTATSGTYRMVEVPLPSALTLQPNTVYTVVLSSVGSGTTNCYRSCGGRSAGYIKLAGNDLVNLSFIPNSLGLINRHDWSGNAERSLNGGSSWSVLGFPGSGGNMSFALRLDGNVSSTEEGLS